MAGGERAYVLDASQGHVRTYDSSDLSLVKDIPLAPGPTTAVVDSHGTLFAVNRTSGQVTVVDADGSSSRQTAGGPGSTVTLVGDHPYLVDPSAGRVVALGSDDGKPGKRSCLDGVDGQQVMATGSGPGDGRAAVFTISPAAGRLTTTDLDSGKCATLNLNDDDDAPHRGCDVGLRAAPWRGATCCSCRSSPGARCWWSTWPTTRSSGRSTSRRCSPTRPRGGETATIPPFELVLDDGNVWFNSLAGPEAGVLDRTGVTLRVLKYEAAEGGNGKAGNGLGVGDDQAALGVDLDPNHGAARQDGNDDDQASRRDDAGDPAGDEGDGNGSAGQRPERTSRSRRAAGPADRAATGAAQQPNRFPGSGRGRGRGGQPAVHAVEPELAAGPGGAVSAAAA